MGKKTALARQHYLPMIYRFPHTNEFDLSRQIVPMNVWRTCSKFPPDILYGRSYINKM